MLSINRKSLIINIDLSPENYCIIHTHRLLGQTWNRRNTIYNICHWNNALRLSFCFSKVVYLYDLQVSIAKHFSVGSIKSKFGNKEKSWILMILTNDVWNILNINETCNIRVNSPSVSLFETFASNWPSFVTITKPLNNKKGERFCEGLKWMCKLFKINGQKVFKNLSFSRNPLKILLKNLPKKTGINFV